MERKDRRHYTGIAILVIIHLVGLVGMAMEGTRAQTLSLTPVNLIVSGLVMFLFQRSWTHQFAFFLGFVFVLGFFAEVIGVDGGTLFGGYYSYGETLGPKIARVPLVMGLNWVLLLYAVGEMSRLLLPKRESVWVRVVLGAALMVIMDLALEPIAPRLDFWTWAEGEVPVRNYITWFVLSLVFLALYTKLRCKRRNRVAAVLFPIQFVFFLLLRLFI